MGKVRWIWDYENIPWTGQSNYSASSYLYPSNKIQTETNICEDSICILQISNLSHLLNHLKPVWLSQFSIVCLLKLEPWPLFSLVLKELVHYLPWMNYTLWFTWINNHYVINNVPIYNLTCIHHVKGYVLSFGEQTTAIYLT